MQRKEVIGDALRIGGGAEDFFAVGAQRLEPRRDVRGAIGELAVADSQFCADHHLGNFGAQLLTGIIGRPVSVAQIAIEPRRVARGVAELVLGPVPGASFLSS